MKNYLLSEEESCRIKIIKFIAIIFVVYIHSYATEVDFAGGTNTLYLPDWLLLFEDCISQVISKCGVPIFFLISSILLFKTQRSYAKTIRNKMKTLLVPYLIWNTFWIVVFIILQSLSFTSAYFSGSHTPILQCSLVEWFGLYGIGEHYPQDYPLWFVRDLMVVVLIFPFVRKSVDKFPKALLIISVILLLTPVSFPFKIALLWFVIGACLVKLQIHIDKIDNVSMWKFSMLYAICALITLLTDISIVRNLFIFIGIVYWARVSKAIYNNIKLRNVFLTLSKWTFMIYVFHELTLSSVKKLCFKLLPTEPIWLFMEYILIPIFVIAGCIVVGKIFKMLLPTIYKVSTGER